LTISWGIAVADMSHREAKKALAGYKSIEGETYIIIGTKKEQSWGQQY
jgi:hypothetical protein